jgi:hypothetical protein
VVLQRSERGANPHRLTSSVLAAGIYPHQGRGGDPHGYVAFHVAHSAWAHGGVTPVSHRERRRSRRPWVGDTRVYDEVVEPGRVNIRSPEHATWKLILLVEARILPLRSVPGPTTS